ncbi:MAG: amidohydrolase family protein, partial [Candidatus Thermoplasmatota archaeon]|nr:amidohydrolase family protein [Candidatus Thermoplasmatota archaeon]
MSILIRNATIVTQDKKRKQIHGDLYIEDDIICDISDHRLSVEAEYVIDGTHKVALPGLINTHTHVPMTLLRGYGDDMALQEWLEQCIWPVEAKLSKETVRIA